MSAHDGRIHHGRFTLPTGHEFVASMPSSDAQDRSWLLTVTDASGGTAFYGHVPMVYAPRFGPDVADVAALNARIEEVIIELGLE